MSRLDYRAVVPEALRLMQQVSNFVKQGPLEPSLVQLIDIRVSQLNGCSR